MQQVIQIHFREHFLLDPLDGNASEFLIPKQSKDTAASERSCGRPFNIPSRKRAVGLRIRFKALKKSPSETQWGLGFRA